jgi:hypothetical protein
MIDEDSTHHLRRHCEELFAILPAGILLAQAEVGFMNEAGRLKSETGLFAPQTALRPPMKLRVDERKELVPGYAPPRILLRQPRLLSGP